MADIGKINAVALANIAKVDAVAAAAIAKINGLVFTAAAPGAFLLDTYTGAAAGYSVRRLATSATVLMRVRRDTGTGGAEDDDEADVAYDSNNILSLDSAISNASAGVTATTLGQFINVGTVNGTTYTNPDSLTVTASCLVDTWYDQASSNDAAQTTQGNQPQIHDGTADTDLITENGKPAVMFETGQGSPHMSISSITPRSQFAVVKTSLAEQNSGILQPDNPVLHYANNGNLKVHRIPISIGASDPLDQKLVSSIADGASSQHHVNDESSTTAVSTYYNGNVLGGRGAQSNRQCVPLQEYVAYSTVVSGSNYTGIRNNINADYLIYQPTDAPTSGLLADYTGAAAAYSVRQLANTAVISMRVRRDSDDEERNFGFDSNGDLDTAGIAAFCGTANGYVTRWWDQSTEGNHADQATDASQPQIYNGTAVITENGKAAVDFDGSNDHLSIATSLGITGSQARSTFFVLRPEAAGSPTSYQTYFGLGDNSTNQNSQIWDLWPEWSVRLFGGFEQYNTVTINNQYLSTNILSGTNVTDNSFFLDGTEQTATSSASTTVNTDNTVQRIGRSGSSVSTGPYYTGKMQEIVIYATAQTSNRTGIETDIDTYFSIT